MHYKIMEGGKMEEKKEKQLAERSFRFALRIIKMVQALPDNLVGRILGGQVLRSGTSIGANVEEAYAGLTTKDFIHSMNISRKEARETRYWIRLIMGAGLLKKERFNSLLQENEEIIRILTSTVKTAQERQKHS